MRSVIYQFLKQNNQSLLIQIIAAFLVVAAIWWFIDNAATNLARQNIASGFAFLQERAGFGISQTLIEYSEDSSYGRVLLVGLTNTLLAAGLGVFLASFLGLVIGVARLSSNWLVSRLAAVYIEIFRNVPLLLQIMFWYFGVLRNLPRPRNSIDLGGLVNLEGWAFLSNRGLMFPSPVFGAEAAYYVFAAFAMLSVYLGLRFLARIEYVWRLSLLQFILLLAAVTFALIWVFVGAPAQWDIPVLKGFNFKGGLKLIPELVALVLALSIYTAAFIAEIVRAGINAVPKGQSEAASALGLKPVQATRLVIIPQALRVIIPPLTSQYLNLTKNSSLAVAIAYPDLVSVFTGTSQSQTGQAIEIILITMLIYLSLSLLTSMAMNWYNKRISFKGRN